MRLSVSVKLGLAAGLGVALATSMAAGEELALDINVGGSERIVSRVHDDSQNFHLLNNAARAAKYNTDRIHFYQGYQQNRPKIGYVSNLAISAHFCDLVGLVRLARPVNNLVIHRLSGVWFAVMRGSAKRVGQLGINCIFYSTSRDLIAWSEPRLLLPGRLPEIFDCESQPLTYPAILNQRTEGQSYYNIGASAPQIFVRHRPVGCKIDQG